MSIEPQFTYRTYLFSVRLWREHLGEGESEWRGKVEYILGREGRYFREWSALIDFLLEILSQVDLQEEIDGESPRSSNEEK